MSKIYIVKKSFSSLAILEVELIKKTPEMLKVDNKHIKVIWENGFHLPLASRLQRHRTDYFPTANAAVKFAIKVVKAEIEGISKNLSDAEEKLRDITLFATTLEDEEDGIS